MPGHSGVAAPSRGEREQTLVHRGASSLLGPRRSCKQGSASKLDEEQRWARRARRPLHPPGRAEDRTSARPSRVAHRGKAAASAEATRCLPGGARHAARKQLRAHSSAAVIPQTSSPGSRRRTAELAQSRQFGCSCLDNRSFLPRAALDGVSACAIRGRSPGSGDSWRSQSRESTLQLSPGTGRLSSPQSPRRSISSMTTTRCQSECSAAPERDSPPAWT
jgi:hypothetical protein